MHSRIEELLTKLINGDTVSFTPLSRNEQYLKACCNKSGTNELPEPRSRIEALLYRLAEEISKGGGSDTSDATATAADIRKGKTAYVSDGLVVGTAGGLIRDLIVAKELDCTYMFSDLSVKSFVGILEYEDTSSVTDMSSMFYGCSNLTAVPLFDTSSVTNMSSMFQSCSNLTTVPSFDTRSVTVMDGMFNGCSSLTAVPLFDTRSVTNMRIMFSDCSNLTTVPLFDTRSVTDMGGMLGWCSKLTMVPSFDTRSVTDMWNMFNSCSSLTTVPSFDTRSVTDMSNMFNGCSKLTTVPSFDTRSVRSMANMFGNCSKLTTVPSFDTRSVTNMSKMFNGCSSLTTVPAFDTRSVTNMSTMFNGCSSLTTVPAFDTRSVTNMSKMFINCTNLTECWLRNIKTNLTVGSGTTYGHLLTLESLEHLIQELVHTASSRTLTVGSANLEKLANVYVKTIDITDEMRAEDDLIVEKLPFVVCESTDEGAMLITNYALEKNWTIA